ncbi:BgTH12-03372 [Blumeria graminis f. sp. triticale]|nr:BgTH12-03372 [Blumeria graminis f. sp. triticale]
MNEQELGIDSSIQQFNGRSFITVDDENLKETRVFDVNPDPIFKVGTLVTQKDFLLESRGTEGVVEYVMADVVYRISDHLKGLNFGKAKSWNMRGQDHFISLGEGVQISPLIPSLRDRELTRIVMLPRGRSLRSCQTVMEFLVGIRDAILGHQRLFVKNILHGDISDSNIILVSAGGVSKGVLIDLDHAVKVGEATEKNDNLKLTGTMKFMALQRLYYAAKFRKSIARTYHHDLESFFYVFLVGCIEYEYRDESEEVKTLHDWCIKNMMTNFLTKLSCVNLMQIITLDLFSPSFVELKKLATSLRTVLFGDGGIDFQTPDDHERIYKDMITAFNKTIDQIKGKLF